MNFPKGFCSIHRNSRLSPYAKGPKNLCMMIMKVGKIAFSASGALKESFPREHETGITNLRNPGEKMSESGSHDIRTLMKTSEDFH